jgi:uncharacterized protein
VKALRFITVFAITAYLGVAALMFLGQRTMLYVPDTRALSPADAGLRGFTAVPIEPGVRSWWHPPETANAPVIVYFQGNGGALAGRATIFADMANWGAGVLAVGYPGYGGNAGAPSEAALHAIAKANIAWLTRQGVPAARIILYGHSMGTGVAVPLAARVQPGGLILEAPFTSMADAAQRVVWWLPVRWLIRDPFRSDVSIAQVKSPIAWLHGSADSLIPYAMGARLLSAARAPVCAQRIDGGDHDHLWDSGGRAFIKSNAFAMAQQGRCATF